MPANTGMVICALSPDSPSQDHGVGKDTRGLSGGPKAAPLRVDTFKLSNDPHFEG